MRLVTLNFAAMLFAGTAFSQATVSPNQFELETVRFARDVTSFPMYRIGPTAIDGTNNRLLSWVRIAYPEYRFFRNEGPSWINEDRFDITAKAAAPVPEARLHLMLQRILAQRFRLVVHPVREEREVYALVAGKDVHTKLRESTPDTITPPTSVYGPINAVNMTMERLVAMLGTLHGSHLDRELVDMTGLEGRYDVNLEHTFQEFDSSPDSTLLISSLRKIGLNLVAQKITVSCLVIDAAQRPTTN